MSIDVHKCNYKLCIDLKYIIIFTVVHSRELGDSS